MKKIALLFIITLNAVFLFAQNREDENMFPNYSTLQEALTPYHQRNDFEEENLLPLP